nr:PAS domain-containing sensor histidine kinase [Gemmatimonadota bacterium]
HLPRVFEAFYTTKPGVRGIGLGLFVSEGIVRGHRGSLTVASGSGEGTRFTIRLPLEPLDPAFFTAGTGAVDAAAGVQLHS